MLIVELNVAGYRFSGELAGLRRNRCGRAVQSADHPVADAAASPPPRGMTVGGRPRPCR